MKKPRYGGPSKRQWLNFFSSERSLARFAALVPVFLLGAIALAGCASSRPEFLVPAYSPSQLLPRQLPGYEGEPIDVRNVDILEVDNEMRAFLALQVDGGGTQEARLKEILSGILESGKLELRYDGLKTYTAAETFHARNGNCLAFTNLFVALAREAGLTVYFQEVEVPHSWERQGETWLYIRHINAWVDLGVEGEYAVDFNLDPMELDYRRRRISDQEALAQYHNNMSAYWMQQDELARAYAHVREAIRLDGEEAYFWTNLGVLYRRARDDARAEAAWLHAVEVGDAPSAVSNLARYYRQAGDEALAAYFADRAESYRRSNPFYLYQRAEEAYYQGDYDGAIAELKRAIKIKDDEEVFYRLLGLSYVRQGDTTRAVDAIGKAESLAETAQARGTYNRKLKLLQGRMSAR